MKRLTAVMLVLIVVPTLARAGCLEKYVEANKRGRVHHSPRGSMISSTTTSSMNVSTSTTHGVEDALHDTDTVEKILTELSANELGGLQVAKLTAELNRAGVQKSQAQIAAEIRQLDTSEALCPSGNVMDYAMLRGVLANN